MPFDVNGKIIKSETNSRGQRVFDKNDAVIYCDNGKAQIYKDSDKVLGAFMFYNATKFKEIIKQLKKQDVEIIESYYLTGEGYFKFHYKDADIVCKVLKAKKQRATPVGITNEKENYKYWLRIMRWIDVKYEKILKKV